MYKYIFFILFGILLFILLNNYNTFSIGGQGEVCEHCCCNENDGHTCHTDSDCTGFRHCSEDKYCEFPDNLENNPCDDMTGLNDCGPHLECSSSDPQCIDQVKPVLNSNDHIFIYIAGILFILGICSSCCSASPILDGNEPLNNAVAVAQGVEHINTFADGLSDHDRWLGDGGRVGTGFSNYIDYIASLNQDSGAQRRANSIESDFDRIVFYNNDATDEEKTIILNELNNNWKSYFIDIHTRNNPSMPEPTVDDVIIDYNGIAINLNELYSDGIFNDQTLTNLLNDQNFNDNDNVRLFRREFYGTNEILYIY